MSDWITIGFEELQKVSRNKFFWEAEAQYDENKPVL